MKHLFPHLFIFSQLYCLLSEAKKQIQREKILKVYGLVAFALFHMTKSIEPKLGKDMIENVLQQQALMVENYQNCYNDKEV